MNKIWTGLMRTRALLSVLLLTMVCASAMAGKVKPGYQLGKKADTGLVVLSITISGRETIDNGNFVFLRYRPVGSKAGPMTASAIAMDSGLFAKKPSDFADAYGAIVAYEIKAGEYEIIEREYLPNSAEEHKWTTTGDQAKWRFRVQPGLVTYLGNYNLQIEPIKTVLVWHYPVGNEDVTDRGDRDLPIFVERFKGVPVDKISTALMTKDSPPGNP